MEADILTKRILILAANPTNTARLRLDQEVREIDAGLRRAKRRELFSLKERWAVRARDMRQALLEFEPHIVHFCGHGSSTGHLCLENDLGQQQMLNPEALAELFGLCSKYVECVILNACYSEIQSEAINEHIQYVIGMNHAIGDKAAIEFSVGFYDALGSGRNIEDSYRFGRNAIALEGIPENLTPTLKIRGSSETKELSHNWNNEAYVSLHLVQEILEKAGLPRRSSYTHWYPQFKIEVKNTSVDTQKKTIKPVDFLIKDFNKNLDFLIEVKTANTRIDDIARFQLRTYLQYSGVRFGILIDPFLIEIHEWNERHFNFRDSCQIENPEQVQKVSDFLRNFIESIN